MRKIFSNLFINFASTIITSWSGSYGIPSLVVYLNSKNLKVFLIENISDILFLFLQSYVSEFVMLLSYLDFPNFQLPATCSARRLGHICLFGIYSK